VVLCHQGTTMVLVLAQAGMPGQYPGVAWPVQVRVASIVIWGPGGHPQAGSLGTAVCVFCKRTGTVASPVYVSALARLQLSGWRLGLTRATCSSIAGLGGKTVWGSRVPGLSGRPLANHSHLRAA